MDDYEIAASIGLGLPVLLAVAWFVPVLVSLALSFATTFLFAPGNRGDDSSPTYGIDRFGNTLPLGSPIPIVIGTRVRVEPPLISLTTKIQGARPTFNALYLVSYGELENFDSDLLKRLKINGQPAESMTGLKATMRYGAAGQTQIPGFDLFGRGQDYSVFFKDGSVSVTHEMVDVADEIHLMLVWSGGLFRTKSDGGIAGTSGGVKIETLDLGDPKAKWQPASIDKTGGRNADWRNYLEKPGDATAGTWYTSGNTTQTLRRQIEYRFPKRGRYKVKITGTLWDDAKQRRSPTLTGVNEVTQDASRTYEGYAVLGLEGIPSETLSGEAPRVTLFAKGVKMLDPRSGASAATDNPALILRHMLRDSKWGYGYAANRVHDASGQSFRTFADRCDGLVSVRNGSSEKRYTWNGVLDARVPIEDHAQAILQTCRAALYEADGQVRIAEDVGAASARVFDARAVTTNRRNVLADDEGRPILSYPRVHADQRFTHVVVQYVDARDDRFELTTFTYPDPPATDPKPREVRMLGITRTTQAEREANYLYQLLQADELVEIGIGWGDHDLLPFERITVFDDYWNPAGKDYVVLSLRFGGEGGRGTVHGIEYVAGAYGAVTADATKPPAQVGSAFGGTLAGAGGATAQTVQTSGAPPKTQQSATISPTGSLTITVLK